MSREKENVIQVDCCYTFCFSSLGRVGWSYDFANGMWIDVCYEYANVKSTEIGVETGDSFGKVIAFSILKSDFI